MDTPIVPPSFAADAAQATGHPESDDDVFVKRMGSPSVTRSEFS